MKLSILIAAGTIALAAGITGASAQVDEAKCVQAKNDSNIADIKAFCPETDWPQELAPEAHQWVMTQTGPEVTMEKMVVVGDPVPDTAQFVAIPNTTHVFAMVSGKRVVVDTATGRVIAVY
jgi:hypothetical protein